jgi:hypothetical protein
MKGRNAPTVEDVAIDVLTLRAEVERLNKENDDWHKSSQIWLADNDRLRADNERLVESCSDLSQAAGPTKTLVLHNKNAEIRRLQKVVADQALTIGAQLDTIGALRCQQEMWAADKQDRVNGATIAEFMKAVANLQKLLSDERSLTAAAAQHTTALERKLEWFERYEREALLKVLREPGFPSSWAYYHKWLSENPKPGAAT